MALAPGENPVQAQVDRLRESLTDAEQVLQAARAGAGTGAAVELARAERDKEREVRSLKARVEDQAGEVARLKAALATFEQADQAETGLRNSRLALKARAGSAEAHAERQAATIAKLRAELAAANERLAQQAAHFMDEMRRLGSGTAPPAAQARRPGRDGPRRRLAERVAQIPAAAEPVSPPGTVSGSPPATLQAAISAEKADSGVPKLAGNGKGPEDTPQAASRQADPQVAAPVQAVLADAGAPDEPKNGPKPAPANPPPPAAPAAAEMPQTAAIPEQRRRIRLLDRITGLGKA
jgi:hypothetical protein